MTPEALAAQVAQQEADQRLRKERLRRGQSVLGVETKAAGVRIRPQQRWFPPGRDPHAKYRVLIVHDCHRETQNGTIGWAHWRRSQALQRYAEPGWQVDTVQSSDLNYDALIAYDLLFHLDYMGFDWRAIRRANPSIRLVVSFNSDSRRRSEMFQPVLMKSDFVVINNLEAFNSYGRPQRTCCIPNGVCADTFIATTPISDRPHKVFWTGSGNILKGKGVELLLAAQPALESLGFQCEFRQVNEIVPEQVLTTEDLVRAYDKSSYVVCMSKSDASPNYLLEAALMGAVPVSCRVGNLQEFGRDRENCVFIDRSAEALVSGLEYARAHRERLSTEISKAMRGWTYGHTGNRADAFYSLFRRLIAGEDIQPFYALKATA